MFKKMLIWKNCLQIFPTPNTAMVGGGQGLVGNHERLLFEKTSCPDLPGLGAFKLFHLVPGLVLQLSYYHLKGDILASVITLQFFSNYSKLRWEREALFVGVPLRYPRKPECGSRNNQSLSLLGSYSCNTALTVLIHPASPALMWCTFKCSLTGSWQKPQELTLLNRWGDWVS